ncbi:SCO4848 family membrane protein [Nonomuraea sp. NPDC003214]
MSRKIAGFLVALAAFMVFEWINLGFNLQDGHDTGFYVVHGILIAVNIILAVVLGIIGLRGLGKAPSSWRRAARRPDDGSRRSS